MLQGSRRQVISIPLINQSLLPTCPFPVLSTLYFTFFAIRSKLYTWHFMWHGWQHFTFPSKPFSWKQSLVYFGFTSLTFRPPIWNYLFEVLSEKQSDVLRTRRYQLSVMVNNCVVSYDFFLTVLVSKSSCCFLHRLNFYSALKKYPFYTAHIPHVTYDIHVLTRNRP